mgnify:CR=1 FL=1
MRTTIEVSAKLMEEVLVLSGAHKKKDAISLALEEFVRRKKTEKLLSLPGKIDIADVSRELEEAELTELRNDG